MANNCLDVYKLQQLYYSCYGRLNKNYLLTVGHNALTTVYRFILLLTSYELSIDILLSLRYLLFYQILPKYNYCNLKTIIILVLKNFNLFYYCYGQILYLQFKILCTFCPCIHINSYSTLFYFNYSSHTLPYTCYGQCRYITPYIHHSKSCALCA